MRVPDLRDLYLTAMESAVTNQPLARTRLRPSGGRGLKPRLRNLVIRELDKRGWALTRAGGGDLGQHLDAGYTMVGVSNVRFLRRAYEALIAEGVPGDLIETGVWRGGVGMYLAALLKAHGDSERTVWLADSFQGVPPPNPAYSADAGDRHHEDQYLAVSAGDVRQNLAAYGLLDPSVKLLEGWFKDTLRDAPIERIALARLDGDLYESTMDVLTALYDRCSPGAVVIIDDYSFPPCRQAVDDFRAQNGVAEPVFAINASSAYWRAERDEPL